MLLLLVAGAAEAQENPDDDDDDDDDSLSSDDKGEASDADSSDDDGDADSSDDDGDDDEDDDEDAKRPPAGDAGDGKPTKSDGPEPKKKKKDAKEEGLTLSARVFVRNTSSKAVVSGAEWRNAFDVSSARANVDFRKYGWLRGSLEVEFSENDLELKDVFLRTRVYPGVTIKVGNFKRPISPIALESIWTLPVIERGLLARRVQTANYIVPLNLGGRSQGAMVTYEQKTGVRPKIDVGLFNANLPTRSSGGAELADQADNLLRDVYMRGQIEPIDGFTVGGTLVAFTQARFPDRLKTRVLGSLDVTLDTHNFRAWLEGFAGRTPFFDGTESIGGLLALRVLLAARLHRPTPWLRLVEPYAVVSALDPTDEKQDNQATELGGGVVAYFKKNFRLQLEYSRTLNDDEFPQPAFSILDVQTLRIQLGARFR